MQQLRNIGFAVALAGCGSSSNKTTASQIILWQSSLTSDGEIISYYRSPVSKEVADLISNNDFKLETNVPYTAVLFIGSHELSLSAYNNKFQPSTTAFIEMHVVQPIEKSVIYDLPLVTFHAVKGQ